MVVTDIVIVEDDPSLANTIDRNLSVRGYQTKSVATVSQAMATLDDACPALVLLDIDLPDGSGWDVLRKLRASGRTDTPVIVISALRPNPRLVRELQCCAVLEKPFPMESLLRLITESLAGQEKASSTEAVTYRRKVHD